jgi:hypothetical protein
MPLNFITHNGNQYPDHEAIGGASLWIRALAQYYCKGTGLDIGYSKEKWMLPGAIGIEPAIDSQWDAMRLPAGEYEYIHSSHCLEHVKENVYTVLDYWISRIRTGGIMFLYLPHASQTYWHPQYNRKHIHSFTGAEIGDYLRSLGHKVWVSGCDFNHSFVVVCEKMDYVSDRERMVKITNECKEILIADEREQYCKERGISYIRDGNNVIYNEPTPVLDIPKGHYPTKDLLYGKMDSHGDMLMHGCFDKSISESKFHVKNPEINDIIHICAICEQHFKINKSKYSDRSDTPVSGDYLYCPNCNTFFIFKEDFTLYKPNIFTTIPL